MVISSKIDLLSIHDPLHDLAHVGGSSSPTVQGCLNHTGSAPPTNETAAYQELSGPLAESYHDISLQDMSKCSEQSYSNQSNKKSSLEVDTLSNVARRISHGTGSSSPSPSPNLQASGIEQAKGSSPKDSGVSDAEYGRDNSEELPHPSLVEDQL